MRIVGGLLKGRTLTAPVGNGTRPTSDRARQAIFDILTHAPWSGPDVLENATVLDAYAGTGALGIEALSRGAVAAAFIERDRQALKALRTNLDTLALRDRARVLSCSATHPPRADRQYTLIFLDPPYGKNLVAAGLIALQRTGWIAESALIVTETDATETGAGEESTHPLPSPGFPTVSNRPDTRAHAHAGAQRLEQRLEPLAERRFGAAKVTFWRYISRIS